MPQKSMVGGQMPGPPQPQQGGGHESRGQMFGIQLPPAATLQIPRGSQAINAWRGFQDNLADIQLRLQRAQLSGASPQEMAGLQAELQKAQLDMQQWGMSSMYPAYQQWQQQQNQYMQLLAQLMGGGMPGGGFGGPGMQ
jgi:hypothetical protein